MMTAFHPPKGVNRLFRFSRASISEQPRAYQRRTQHIGINGAGKSKEAHRPDTRLAAFNLHILTSWRLLPLGYPPPHEMRWNVVFGMVHGAAG